jgi:hypothetical protein
LFDDRADAGLFIEAGNDCGAILLPIRHAARMPRSACFSSIRAKSILASWDGFSALSEKGRCEFDRD